MLKFKIIWVILITSLLFLVGCDEKKDYFTIKGSLTNLDAPYFFIAMEVSDSILVDTIRVDKQGMFSYKGNVDTLTIASLYFDKGAWSTSVFVNKQWDINIKGDVNRPDLIRVEGGNVNDDLTAFKKANDELLRSRVEILIKINEATSPEIIQTYSAELKNINFNLTNNARSYVEKHPDKIASVVLTQDFFKNDSSVEQLDTLLSLFKGQAVDFSLTDDLRKFSDKVKLSRVGAYAPHFVLKNGDKELNISKHRGKYLYLTFASENGEVYKNSLPVMADVYKKLKNKNVEFASVVINSVEENCPDSIKWPVFYDKKNWAAKSIDLYNVTELPYSILISPEGRILERGMTVANLPEKIEELQKNKAK